ncbi:MFS transporter [Geodermatophilus ruber]|uniref:Major Facilitator Superfamily protein n=1 Tax=Geodermatophilus ruber TaxID=504800 RepID=A0A1I4KKW6_9ACTN|nr:MFS transporter [Geodermatophilus ruber]SFL79404.1 Major Facilitator Superfamily protein [Geodermatophilus ruber]
MVAAAAGVDALSTRLRAGALLTALLLGGASAWSLTAAGAGVTDLAPAYDTSLVGIGLLTTAFGVPYAIGQIPAGMLIDRIGVRPAALLGLGMTLLAYLAASLAPVMSLAIGARAVAGAGSAVCFVAGVEVARRAGLGPTALGFFGGASLAVGGAAVAVVPAAGGVLGWRSAWLTCALAAALAIVSVALHRTPPVPLTPPRQSGPGASVLRDRELHRLALVQAVNFGMAVVLSVWAATVLERTWGAAPGAAAGLASVILLCATVSQPLGGYLNGRYPDRARRITLSALVGCAAGTALLAMPSHVAVALVAVTVIGIMSGLPFAGLVTAAQARRPERPAAAVGLLNGLANGVILLGTPLLGAAIDHSWTTAALLAVAGLWLAPLLALPHMWRKGPRHRVTGPLPASGGAGPPR